MSLKGPTVEDQRKIHAETNQIIHQRFLLCTLAISVFGALTAWIFPKQAPNSGDPIGGFVFIGTSILISILFALYVLSHVLRQIQITFTSYLRETNASGWEQDYAHYRSRTYFSYTKGLTFVFMLLNVLSFILPFFIGYVYSLKYEPSEGVLSLLATFIITTIFIYLMGFQNVFDYEQKAIARWNELNSLKGGSRSGRNK